MQSVESLRRSPGEAAWDRAKSFRRLGRAAWGEVWKARDTRLDRVVALKVSKAAFTERFEREARAVAALSHPNIRTLHDVGPNYLVMEFIEGAPLKGPLPLQEAVEYAAQILDASDAAHRILAEWPTNRTNPGTTKSTSRLFRSRAANGK